MRRITRRKLLGGGVTALIGVIAGALGQLGWEAARAANNYSTFLPFVTKGYAPPSPTATPTNSPTAIPTPLATSTPTLTPMPSNASPVFRINNIPMMTWSLSDASAVHSGVDALLDLMANNGSCFYRSSSSTPWSSTMGILNKDDIVIIKVNSQWLERGETNTDVVRGLVRRITSHPDGFTGEVVIADNGQDPGTNHLTDGSSHNDDNLPNHTQSCQVVANLFSAQYHVSTYNWSTIAAQVQEWDQGDTRDGYVLAGPYPLNYPKFTTLYGTRISARLGVWNGTAYDSGRLKLINIPVLKAHGMFGMTGATKNFVGFMSRFVGVSEVNNDNWAFHNNFTQAFNGLSAGLPGSLMNLRYPNLNIIDATYVSPYGNTTDKATYSQTPRQSSLLAGLDPTALDYYAVKYILLPLMQQYSVSSWNADPDQSTACRSYLLASQARLQAAGRTARFGEGGYSLVQYTMP